MPLFLLEVRKRTDIPSIIWLHDGLWIGSEVDDQVLFAAERHVRNLLFPHSDLTSSLFLITSLHDAWQAVASTCPPPPSLYAVYKAPDENCAGERLPGSCLLPNSATDKLQSVSCRVTSTEYTSGHAYATDKPMGHAVLVSCTVGYAFLPPTVFASNYPCLLVFPSRKTAWHPCVRGAPQEFQMLCRCVVASRSLVNLPGSALIVTELPPYLGPGCVSPSPSMRPAAALVAHRSLPNRDATGHFPTGNQ